MSFVGQPYHAKPVAMKRFISLPVLLSAFAKSEFNVAKFKVQYHHTAVVPLVFRLDEGSCSSTCLERDKTSVFSYVLDSRLSPKKASKYVPIALDKVVSLSKPSCSAWIVTAHFLKSQIHARFQIRPLIRTQWHKRGFPVPLGSLVPIFV